MNIYSNFHSLQPKQEVCGRDGVTYESRCYMQVAECSQHRKIRVAHRGPCSGVDTQDEDGHTEKPKKMDRKRKKPMKRKPADGHPDEHAQRNRKRVERKRDKAKKQKQQGREERKMKKRKLRKARKRAGSPGGTLEDVQWQDYDVGEN